MMQHKRFSLSGLLYACLALIVIMAAQAATLAEAKTKTQQLTTKTQQRNLTIELQQLALADTLLIEQKEER